MRILKERVEELQVAIGNALFLRLSFSIASFAELERKNFFIICLIEIMVTWKHILLKAIQISIFGKVSSFSHVIKPSLYGKKYKMKTFFQVTITTRTTVSCKSNNSS